MLDLTKFKGMSPREYIQSHPIGFKFTRPDLEKDTGAPDKSTNATISKLCQMGMVRHIGYDTNAVLGAVGRPRHIYQYVKDIPRRRRPKTKPVPSPDPKPMKYVHIDEYHDMGFTIPIIKATPKVEVAKVDVEPVPESKPVPTSDHLRLMNNMLDFLTSYEVLVNENKALRERLSKYENP